MLIEECQSGVEGTNLRFLKTWETVYRIIYYILKYTLKVTSAFIPDDVWTVLLTRYYMENICKIWTYEYEILL